MKGLDNIVGKGRGVLHVGDHEKGPVTPPKHSHARTNTASTIVSEPSAMNRYVNRSDTTRTAGSYRSKAPRPPLVRVPTVQTKYMEMLLHLDRIPKFHNILAAIFGWILLAGFLVIPGTFTSFRDSKTYQNASGDAASDIANSIVNAVDNVPLVYVSAFLSGLGAIGCIGLWIRWRRNYVWLINRIFLPTVLSSLAGVLSTVINVYTARDGVWSLTAKIAVWVTGGCAGVSLLLFAMYQFWFLGNVIRRHDEAFPEELRRKEKQKKNENLVEKVKRKAHEPALQPGSVV